MDDLRLIKSFNPFCSGVSYIQDILIVSVSGGHRSDETAQNAIVDIKDKKYVSLLDIKTKQKCLESKNTKENSVVCNKRLFSRCLNLS